MTVQYLGARTVNERRRRRLALEAAHAEPLAAAFEARPETAKTDGELIPAVERTRIVSRINSLIRPEPWKTWAAVAVAAVLGIAVVWGGAVIDRLFPAVSEVFGLAAGRATRFYSLLMLLSVTQLSFIILWYRTHSRKDFHGRYRVWIWSSIVWPVFLVSAITNVHLLLSRRVGTAIPSLGAAFGDRLWMIPAVILFWSTARVISRDMSRCRVSRWLLRGSAVLAAASLAVNEFSLPGLHEIGLIGSRSLEAAWPMLLAAALLHHARFVIHVTNEVSSVKRRPNRWMAVLRAGWDEMWLMLPSHTRATQHFQMRHLAVASRWLAIALMVVGRRCLLITRRLTGRLISAATTRLTGMRLSRGAAKPPRKPKKDVATSVPPAADDSVKVQEPVAAPAREQSTPIARSPVAAGGRDAASSSNHSRRDHRKGRPLQSAGR